MATARQQLLWTAIELDGQEWTLIGSERGLCRVIFPHESLEHFRGWTDKVAPGARLQQDEGAFERMGGVPAKLRAYFAGEAVSFADVPLDLIGTDFQRAVWQALGEVPYGQTRTYGDIARAVGRPQAVRAVGMANGANPVPVLLPCHRIIGADRKLTGFRGGLAMKRRLLELERIEGVVDGGHARFEF
ncbi:methylated-DNA--[protein]-cysteine S-methyltransferase [Paenibacillus chartarius]|uniref:Methylated-DNA--protein-cysteine methyltransferase n=1 Tax=Paenibacillus chartarius TaxID=747481 RepID=A0ABV6DS50_9BACL